MQRVPNLPWPKTLFSDSIDDGISEALDLESLDGPISDESFSSMAMGVVIWTPRFGGVPFSPRYSTP